VRLHAIDEVFATALCGVLSHPRARILQTLHYRNPNGISIDCSVEDIEFRHLHETPVDQLVVVYNKGTALLARTQNLDDEVWPLKLDVLIEPRMMWVSRLIMKYGPGSFAASFVINS
jgi:hypothetical protein